MLVITRQNYKLIFKYDFSLIKSPKCVLITVISVRLKYTRDMECISWETTVRWVNKKRIIITPIQWNMFIFILLWFTFRYLNFVVRNVTEHSKRKRIHVVSDGPKLTVRQLVRNWPWIHLLKLKRDVIYLWNMIESFGKCLVSLLYIYYIVNIRWK